MENDAKRVIGRGHLGRVMVRVRVRVRVRIRVRIRVRVRVRVQTYPYPNPDCNQGDATPQNYSNALWAYATVGHDAPGVLDEVAEYSESGLGSVPRCPRARVRGRVPLLCPGGLERGHLLISQEATSCVSRRC